MAGVIPAGTVGLIEKSAEMYVKYGVVFFQAGWTKEGRKWFETAVALFYGLDHDYDSDFYCVRSIWVKSLHGLQEVLCAGNPRIILDCELETEQGLVGRFTCYYICRNGSGFGPKGKRFEAK